MPDLLIEKQGHTTIFTLNRPHRLNALGGTLTSELVAGIEEFERDPNQYVAIVTGAGDRAFSAGGDLKEMAANAAAGGEIPVSGQPDVGGLAACEKVTIAAINGLAVAGGLEIAISCDIRIASENAWFGVPEVKRGLVAGTAVNILPRLLPIGAVFDLVLSGDRMTAQQALTLGLVQQVVPHERLLETALAKAEAIGRNSPAAVWGSKQVVKYWRNAMLTEQHQFYGAINERVLQTRDAVEGSTAFAEKRDPTFQPAWPSRSLR